MDISLSSDNEKFLQSQIAAGIYKSINEAINAAINIAIVDSAVSNKKIEEFNNEVKIGLDAVKNNDVLDGHSVMEEFKKSMNNKLNLKVTRPAYNDMVQIFEYIARDNRLAAAKLLGLFEEQFERLLMFPNSGFKSKFPLDSIKVSIVARHYQIVYIAGGEILYILRVLTGYQDIFK